MKTSKNTIPLVTAEFACMAARSSPASQLFILMHTILSRNIRHENSKFLIKFSLLRYWVGFGLFCYDIVTSYVKVLEKPYNIFIYLFDLSG